MVVCGGTHYKLKMTMHQPSNTTRDGAITATYGGHLANNEEQQISSFENTI